MSDAEFEEDLKFVCKTFFGADSEEALAAFARKQRTMKVDLDKLDLSNINFLENEGTEWQAQLLPSSYSRYKAGNLQEKYIEVNVDGATDYYRYMGNSDEALANTLIHEQAHGFPGVRIMSIPARSKADARTLQTCSTWGTPRTPHIFAI
ncbi:hypothetical protein [Pseudomonas sp. JAI120]|uniref:hypothetical protein n=1 Tax=Pseudomonas sp. JAI120 TaxID=2723063 RepID=UPI0030D883D0